MKSFFIILFINCFLPVTLFAQTSVSTVVDAYFSAIGGVDLINQVETFYSISDTEINGEKLVIYKKQKKPNLKSIVFHKNGEFLSKKVLNDDSGYEIIGKHKKEYSKEEVSSKTDQLSIFPEFFYLKKAVFLGEKEVMGKTCNILGVGEKRIYYDVLSGLKLKGSDVKFIKGERVLKETYYIDYKEVKGIKFPVLFRSIVGNREIIYNVTTISLNRDVSISDFE